MTRSRLALDAILVAAPFVFFHEVCLQGKAFLLRDLFTWFYPWRRFAADSFARGDPPLWNPYSYAGTPFLANMQSGLLYPPNVVFWALEFPSAARLFIVVQFAMAAWFMYLLLRAHSCRPASALTGGIAYAYGGWMVVHIEFPNKLAAAAWLPLILLGLTHWWRGRPARGLAIGGLATALCVTAGYPQTTFTVLLGAGVIWGAEVYRAVWRRVRDRARDRPSPWAAAASMPLVVGLGLLVSAAQVLPFLEALSLSARKPPFEPAQVLSLGLQPAHFLDLLAPRLFGMPGYQRYWGGSLYQYWLGHFYVGLPTLALAAASLLDRRTYSRASLPGCAALLILSAAFCLGDLTPLAPFCVEHLPGFAHFKWLSTTSILIAFALCWLAAFGLDSLLEALQERRRPPRVLLVTLAVGAAAALFAGLLAYASPGRFDSLARAAVSGVAKPDQAPLIMGHLGPARSDAIRSALLVAALAIAWLAAASGRLKGGVAAALVPLGLFFDLKGAAAGVNFAADPAIFREVPPNVRRLAERPDQPFRVYVPDETLRRDLWIYGSETPDAFRWAANTLLFNLNLPHRIFSASDGDPMWTGRWKAYHQLLNKSQ